jgi:protocatechuate 3,4-dioxygenase beta subunit
MGPYYKTNSPEAANLVQDGMQGAVITISGQVLDQAGNPVANALLDFWQANASGQYDKRRVHAARSPVHRRERLAPTR